MNVVHLPGAKRDITPAIQPEPVRHPTDGQVQHLMSLLRDAAEFDGISLTLIDDLARTTQGIASVTGGVLDEQLAGFFKALAAHFRRRQYR